MPHVRVGETRACVWLRKPAFGRVRMHMRGQRQREVLTRGGLPQGRHQCADLLDGLAHAGGLRPQPHPVALAEACGKERNLGSW